MGRGGDPQGTTSLGRWTRIAAWPLRLLWYNLYFWLVAPLRRSLAAGLSFGISEGELFVVRSPLRVTVLTHWRAPYTGGLTCVVPAGTQLVALGSTPVGSKEARFAPRSQTAFARALIPASVRENPRFDSASLVLRAGEIETQLSRVSGP